VSKLVDSDACPRPTTTVTRAPAPRQVQHAEYVPEVDDYRKTMSGLKGLGSLTARRCVRSIGAWARHYIGRSDTGDSRLGRANQMPTKCKCS
jgi:hypothetical protein